MLIDIILSQMAYYAAQCRHLDLVLWTAFIGVAIYNIHGSTLYQLLSLFVNRLWYKLGEKMLVAMQVKFWRYKLLIINKKSMIGFKLLHQIDIYLRSIMVCLDSFFGYMNLTSCSFYCFSINFLGKINILFCDDFAQLYPVGDNALYTLPVAFKALVAIIIKKVAYNAFIETVMLTEVMR